MRTTRSDARGAGPTRTSTRFGEPSRKRISSAPQRSSASGSPLSGLPPRSSFFRLTHSVYIREKQPNDGDHPSPRTTRRPEDDDDDGARDRPHAAVRSFGERARGAWCRAPRHRRQPRACVPGARGTARSRAAIEVSPAAPWLAPRGAIDAYIYIYIYIERERERERSAIELYLSLSRYDLQRAPPMDDGSSRRPQSRRSSCWIAASRGAQSGAESAAQSRTTPVASIASIAASSSGGADDDDDDAESGPRGRRGKRNAATAVAPASETKMISGIRDERTPG